MPKRRSRGEPSEHETVLVPPAYAHVPAVVVTEVKLVWVESTSVSATPLAAIGPSLATFIVQVTERPSALSAPVLTTRTSALCAA